MDRSTMQVVFHEINKLDAECEDRFEGESSRRTLRDLSTRLQTLENEYLAKMAEDFDAEQWKKDHGVVTMMDYKIQP